MSKASTEDVDSSDMTTTQQLAEATASRDAARQAFNAAKVGSKAWRLAEEDLNYWIGAVAMLGVMTSKGM